MSLTDNQTKLKFVQSLSKNSQVFVNETRVWIKVETLNKLKKHLIAGSVVALAMCALAAFEMQSLRGVAPES